MTECNICHLELSDPRRIECGHIFCFHCLGNHVRSSPSCPTCERPMKPKLGKVDSYPVAMEIIHLLQSLHKVESCGKIVDDEDDENVDPYEDIDSDKMQMTATTSPNKPTCLLSDDVCDIHGQRLVSVCTTCDDELICAKCSIHSTHNKQDISEHNQYLSNLLSKQKDKLLQQAEDKEAEEEKLQEMIEKQINQKDTIKDEIEEIAEEMFAQIHRKKEEMLHPIEDKTDEFVKHLSNRQEQSKDQKSEFNYIRSKIGNLSIDNPLDFCRKAKRVLKQANIALRVGNEPVPQYQTIKFIRNETATNDLKNLVLGEVKINGVLPAQSEEYDRSECTQEDLDYDDTTQVQNKELECELSNGTDLAQQTATPTFKQKDDLICIDENVDEGTRSKEALPPPLGPKPENPSVTQHPFGPPPVSPAPDGKILKVESHYALLNTASYSNSNHCYNTFVSELQQESHYGLLPFLSPFSGTFRKSVSIAIDNRAFPQKLCNRVFLPFRPSGFTVVQGSHENYYTFVTDDHEVKMIKQNGDAYRTITDLVKPFDAASQQREKLTPLYITDEGRRTGDGSVRVYTSKGVFQKVLVGKLKKPQGISISRAGHVYVCDEANILVFCPKTGKRKRIISTIGKDPIFEHPLYVMVSATGKILVSDVGTRELKIHDETRNYTDKFKPDEDKGELYTSFTPGMCAEDSSSNYFVIDQGRNMLYMLQGGGKSEGLPLPQNPKDHHGIPTAVSFANDTGNIVVF
ncbi:Tripartite motif-containing protein 2 [Mizuhopecten yessoensis]|uniref:Tripartite motif-containing protein 2 n=2 Tax=Mizuhopecten yessoensis TaxID=6573 RepID=A0A210QW72_MIZYE|nr:Tripartite motif-containing protein 2 [Mizuhopecten yessoensis]